MTKELPNRCPHLNCLVAHEHVSAQGCDCDMSKSCPICKQEQLYKKEVQEGIPLETRKRIQKEREEAKRLENSINCWRCGVGEPIEMHVCEQYLNIVKSTFRAWDGKEWRYSNLFLSHDGKLWYRYDGRKLKEVDWKLQFNY